MDEHVAGTESGPLKKLDQAVIAPKPVQRYRAAAFQAYALFAAVGFVVLAVLARTSPYFPIDLRVTLAVQSYHGVLFDRLMFGLSWLGFMPQVDILGALVILSLAGFGLRWEAVAATFAAMAALLGTLVKLIVHRPRPSADLVHVFSELKTSGFPSGHVLEFTALCGFLMFLVYTLIKPSWGRSVLLALLGLVIALMGPSRIYQGQHWFSDVMGAYLLGSLWLALTIRFYRWGKPRYFVHQPVAPEVPAPKSG
jgi:undecaprenyl-diphosphatase